MSISVPVVCSKCKRASEVRDIFAGFSGATLTLSNNWTRCPRCGGDAAIVNGKFEIVDGTMRAIDSVAQEDLARLVSILQQERDLSAIAKRVDDEAPSASTLLRFAPKDSTQLIAWFAFLLALLDALGLIPDLSASPPPAPPEIHVHIDSPLSEDTPPTTP